MVTPKSSIILSILLFCVTECSFKRLSGKHVVVYSSNIHFVSKDNDYLRILRQCFRSCELQMVSGRSALMNPQRERLTSARSSGVYR